MSGSDILEASADFVVRLRSLRSLRRDRKLEVRRQVIRKPLSSAERDEVFKKTEAAATSVGGLIEGAWEADHVFSHSLGGQHKSGQLSSCSSNMQQLSLVLWSRRVQEWILKLGVWLRTQIEKETALGRLAGTAFCSHERARARRRIARNLDTS